MLKLSKKADYGLIALRHLALHHGEQSCSAADISDEYGVPAQLMAKVLQRLARKGLLKSKHGSAGGYTLAQDPSHISVLDAISAIDGPQAIITCAGTHGVCGTTELCSVREPLHHLNERIMQLLAATKISQMTGPQGPRSAVVELKAS
jgi:FeS assembly SUF system regulator